MYAKYYVSRRGGVGVPFLMTYIIIGIYEVLASSPVYINMGLTECQKYKGWNKNTNIVYLHKPIS
jgi:hypothetical protein